MKIELPAEEQEILNQILEGAFKTIEVEQHRTDDIRFKEHLGHRCEVIEGLLARISPQVESA